MKNKIKLTWQQMIVKYLKTNEPKVYNQPFPAGGSYMSIKTSVGGFKV